VIFCKVVEPVLIAAGANMLLMVLNSVKLPVEAGTPVAPAYGMILGIDALVNLG
jgi:hypothetical protein